MSKLSNVFKNDVVKKTEYKEIVKKINNISTTDTSNLVKKTDYNTRISEIEKQKLLIIIMINILILKNLIN